MLFHSRMNAMHLVIIVSMLMMANTKRSMLSYRLKYANSKLLIGIADPSDFPWHATIFIRSGLNSRKFGSGALISAKHVVTSAQLLWSGDLVGIRFGSTFNDGRMYAVDTHFIHTHYLETKSDANNIGVIRLSQSVRITKFLQPIVYAGSSEVSAGKSIQISGFNVWSEYMPTEKTLLFLHYKCEFFVVDFSNRIWPIQSKIALAQSSYN